MAIAKVAAIHDITGVGRCGLSVVVPVLSAFGHQVCPLPTAVLSTHPAGFEGIHNHALDTDTKPILTHWLREGLTFDACFTGFMSSAQQVRDVMVGIKNMKPGVLLVDPVLGDHGKLYGIVDAQMVDAMRELAAVADLITPNLTEVFALLGREYVYKSYTHTEASELAETLAAQCRADCIIKGVPCEDGCMMNVLHMYETKQTFFAEYAPVATNYPGTGDVFASILLGAYLHTKGLERAFQAATRVTTELVAYTYKKGTPAREGVLVEAFCPQMIARCGLLPKDEGHAGMTLQVVNQAFSVCQVGDLRQVEWTDAFCFVGKTDEENSVVCCTESVPPDVLAHEDGWRALRIQGVLDFSLTGILARLATVLANNQIGIFAISTYNTDYILVKDENLARAVDAFRANGYDVK